MLPDLGSSGLLLFWIGKTILNVSTSGDSVEPDPKESGVFFTIILRFGSRTVGSVPIYLEEFPYHKG